MNFVLSSSSFSNGSEIPRKYTCEGEDISPQLSWSQAPAGTEAFAIIADDPDAPAGTWTHWLVFDLPSSTSVLPENVAEESRIATGGAQGQNDFHKIGYGGPCPPPGKPHRYFFKIFALDHRLDLKPGCSRRELEQAMRGHILAQAEWMGKYHR